LGLSSNGRLLSVVLRFHRITRVKLPSYCPKAFSLSPHRSGAWIKEPMEIENKNRRNFSDLREMRRSAKSLKNSMREHRGILIAP
jgi:hypothetical protein